MFTASGILIGGHFDRSVFTTCKIADISTIFPGLIIINLDKGSIFNKGQGEKLSDMGPPYLCNNSNF